MVTLILFGVPLLIIIIAALLMPWHAQQGEKQFKGQQASKQR